MIDHLNLALDRAEFDVLEKGAVLGGDLDGAVDRLGGEVVSDRAEEVPHGGLGLDGAVDAIHGDDVLGHDLISFFWSHH